MSELGIEDFFLDETGAFGIQTQFPAEILPVELPERRFIMLKLVETFRIVGFVEPCRFQQDIVDRDKLIRVFAEQSFVISFQLDRSPSIGFADHPASLPETGSEIFPPDGFPVFSRWTAASGPRR